MKPNNTGSAIPYAGLFIGSLDAASLYFSDQIIKNFMELWWYSNWLFANISEIYHEIVHICTFSLFLHTCAFSIQHAFFKYFSKFENLWVHMHNWKFAGQQLLANVETTTMDFFDISIFCFIKWKNSNMSKAISKCAKHNCFCWPLITICSSGIKFWFAFQFFENTSYLAPDFVYCHWNKNNFCTSITRLQMACMWMEVILNSITSIVICNWIFVDNWQNFVIAMWLVSCIEINWQALKSIKTCILQVCTSCQMKIYKLSFSKSLVKICFLRVHSKKDFSIFSRWTHNSWVGTNSVHSLYNVCIGK